ncbi:hypothetical protein [Sediminivirga luteola]|uniref:hypothetical protein n=1 Tax=Sediminivirga luteola TaxID=1774748 RepID=UPI001F58EC93|nr:hypothetical protein [Sediminivirga luteola]MCI2265471.1 hypothetical protein [Sediminivirga luteola]
MSTAASAPSVPGTLAERFAPAAALMRRAVRAGCPAGRPLAGDPLKERAEAVRLLAQLGFGRLRLPRAAGGLDADVPALMDLLIHLSAADSDTVQAWRTHLLVTERNLVRPGTAESSRWLGRIASGAMIGGGWTEPGGTATGTFETTLAADEAGNLRLDGRKFYSTGSLYADWLEFSAVRPGGEYVIAGVPASAPGVELRDDWTGFGQKYTASGTTVLGAVPVDPRDVVAWDTQHPALEGWQQAVLLAILAGIAQAAAETAAEALEVAARFGADLPGEDLLGRIGRISARAYGVRAVVMELARELQATHEALVNAWEAQPCESGILGTPHSSREPGALPGATGASVAAPSGRPVPSGTGDLSEIRRQAARGADLASAKAHSLVLPEVLAATNEAAAVTGQLGLFDRLSADRHWRNARTLGCHNPVVFKERMITDMETFGIAPGLSREERSSARQEAWTRLRQGQGKDREQKAHDGTPGTRTAVAQPRHGGQDGSGTRAALLSARATAELIADPSLLERAAGVLHDRDVRVLVLPDRPASDGTAGTAPVFDPSIAAAVLLSRLPGTAFLIRTEGIPPGELPYNFARRLATLEHLSGGAAGWWLDSQDHVRDREFAITVQQLWASWPLESVATSQDAPAFADVAPIRRINRGGEFASAGPLNVPSSPQGLPVVFFSGGLQASAGDHLYADGHLGQAGPASGDAGTGEDAGTTGATGIGAEEWLAGIDAHLLTLPAGPGAGAQTPDGTLRALLGLPVPELTPLPEAAPRFDVHDDADKGAL